MKKTAYLTCIAAALALSATNAHGKYSFVADIPGSKCRAYDMSPSSRKVTALKILCDEDTQIDLKKPGGKCRLWRIPEFWSPAKYGWKEYRLVCQN